MATMTASQKKAEAKADYDAFLAACPSRQLLNLISDKWVTLIVCALGSDADGRDLDDAGDLVPMRYSELSRQIAGVSQKMLTQTLRSLERDGVLTRTVAPTVPVTVTYQLTELGLSMLQMVRGVKDWAETHMDEVLTSRDAYDAKVG